MARRYTSPDGGERLTLATLRPIFYDPAAERAVIGALLNSKPDAVDHCINIGLRAEHFHGATNNGTIYAAIVECHQAGIPCDPVTVHTRLDPERFSVAELFDLWTAEPYTTNLPAYANIVLEHGHERSITFKLETLLNGRRGEWRTAIDELVAETDRWNTTSDAPGAWAPVDLAATDTPAERPYLLTRTDHQALFYMGKVNSLSGPPESAKSWAALCACAEVARNGGHAVYIDYEDNPASVARRLRGLGLDDDELGRIHYYWPETSLEHAVAAIQRLNEPVDVVVVDSNTRATLAAGGKTNSTDDAATLGRILARIARTTGAGVILLDHVTKDDDPNDPYSRGSGDKLAYIDGAAYKVRVLNLFAPGRVGKAEITCVKDRPGGAREHFKNGRAAATFTLESDGLNDPVTVTIDPVEDTVTTDDSGAFRPTGYMERLSRALEVRPEGVGTKELRTLIRGRNEVIAAAIRALIEEAYVTVNPGARGARLHVITRPFREHTDHPKEPENEPF